MGTSGERLTDHGEKGRGTPQPRSVEIASAGIDSTRDMAKFGTALIADIMTGSVCAKVANPVCRTGNLVLRSVEMEQRHNGGNPVPLS